MTNFIKLQKDYTIHFHVAFLHVLNLLVSKLHCGILEPKLITFLLTDTYTSLIIEEGFKLSQPAVYKEISLDDFPAHCSSTPSEWVGDPAVAAGFKLGKKSTCLFYQESRELHTLLDSGQSPRRLERLSLSHLAPLSGHLIIYSFWFTSTIKRSPLAAVCHQLKLAVFTSIISYCKVGITR